METPFAEDDLPEGQEPIKTSNVKRLIKFMTILTDPENRYSTIGVVTGPAGAGKSIASRVCQETLEQRFQSVLPASIKVKVMPRSTPRALANNILQSLRERAKGGNIYEMAEQAAHAIERNDSRLIIVDEADRLREDSFEVIRYLLDKTGCPILLVGLPNISSVIERHEKFSSRVGLRMSFHPLGLEEVLTVVLPGLVFPHWTFDPQKDTDRAMGEDIWRRVCPSLRKLRNLLDVASKLAKANDEPAITVEIIQQAYEWIATQEDQHHEQRKKETKKRDTQKGVHEQKSEQKQEEKEKKKKTDGQ